MSAPEVFYQEYTFVVGSNSRAEYEFKEATFLVILAETGSHEISIDGGANYFRSRVGLKIDVTKLGIKLGRVLVRDTSGSSNTVVVGFGTAEIGDDRVQVVGVTGGVTVVDGGGSISVDDGGTPIDVVAAQSTHDDLNANANLQVGDADVDSDNPVPVEEVGTVVRGYAASIETGDGDVELLAAPGAGLANYITSITVSENGSTAGLVGAKTDTSVILSVGIVADGVHHFTFPGDGLKCDVNEAFNVFVNTASMDVSVTVTGHVK